MYANTGLRKRRARSQFRARELPVRARVYADRVRHRVRDYAVCTLRKYFPSVALSYLILH